MQYLRIQIHFAYIVNIETLKFTSKVAVHVRWRANRNAAGIP